MNNKEVSVERRVGAGVGVYPFFLKNAVLGFGLGWGLVSILTLTLKQHSLKKKKKNRPGRRLRPRDLLTPIKSWQNLKEVMKGVH